MNAYDFLLEKLRLSPADRENLLARGLNIETINENKFVSGGKYIKEFEKCLKEKFTMQELKESCIFTTKEELSDILLQEKIIIPYINKQNVCYNLRPHKLGLANKAPEIYQLKNIKENETVIITEGEFKAAAACQLGFSCVAVPGISAFADKHKGAFCSQLADHKVKNAIILYDREIKDDPRLPNYKADKQKRWDVQYFSWHMATEMKKAGIAARIAEMPLEWTKNGKVDIDQAIRDGHTKDEFLEILSKALEPDDYIDNLSREAQTVIKKRIAKKLFPSKIFKMKNKYFKRTSDEADAKIFPLSNFILKIISTHQTPQGLLRKVIFENEFCEQTEPMYIEAKEMTSADGFASFCMSQGNFIWMGSKQDIMTIWSDEFLEEGGIEISEPDHIGRLKNGMWLFQNVAIAKDGTELAERDGAFFDEEQGYCPSVIDVSGDTDTLPKINITDKMDIKEVYKVFSDTLGKFEASLVIGWVVAVAYMDEIFKQFGCFPFLFVTGKRGSGKSTVAEWIMSFFGFEGSGKLLSDTTTVYIQRAMSYYSSLPLFLDEYRNTGEVIKKNALFRNAYNRQSAGKGIKEGFGIREGKIRGTLLLSGEETPNDNAVQTRCIIINVSKSKRLENQYKWFVNNRHKLSNIFYKIIKKPNAKEFLTAVDKMRKKLQDMDLNDRIAVNFGIVAAGFVSVMRKDESECVKFIEMICHHAKGQQEEQEEETQLSLFWNDLSVMISNGEKIKPFYEIKTYRGLQVLHLNIIALHTLWCKFWKMSRTGEEPFKRAAIINMMKEEPYFMEVKQTRVQKVTCRGILLSFDVMPVEVRSIFVEHTTEDILDDLQQSKGE